MSLLGISRGGGRWGGGGGGGGGLVRVLCGQFKPKKKN